MWPVYAFPPMLAGSVIMALAVVSVSYGRRDRLSLTFSAFCVSWAVVAWVTLGIQLTGSLRWAHLAPAAVWLTYAAMALYVLVLTGHDQDSKVPVFGLRPTHFLAGILLVGAAAVLTAVNTDVVVRGLRLHPRFGYSLVFAPTALLIQLPMSGLGMYSGLLLYRAHRDETAPAKKAFLRNNLIAIVTIVVSAGLFAAVLPYFGWPTFAFAFDAFTIIAFFFFGVLANHQFRQVEELNLGLEAKVEARTLELRQAQARLVQAEKMLTMGRLVAGVAHEINTPLGAMRSMQDTRSRATAKLLDDVRAHGDAARLARVESALAQCDQVLEQGLDRVDAVVRQLKSFARLDEADLQTIDINRSIEEALSLLGPDLDHVQVRCHLESTGKVTCLSRQMNQVLLAVLTNAAQAAGHHGQVRVRTEDTSAGVRIQVEDDGEGVAAEHLPRVFDPGFTTKGVGVGTGMGLAIAYRVMQEHGGQIELHSVLGEGTEVVLTLPREFAPPTSGS